jgi:hypothetical protein
MPKGKTVVADHKADQAVESFVNEVRHQATTVNPDELVGDDWTTELADYASDEALEVLRAKLAHPSNHIPYTPLNLVGVDADYTVELWRFENPSGFVYVNLYATHDGAQEYNSFHRDVSGVFDIAQHTEMRQLMQGEMQWTPWDSLSEEVQRFITLHVLPDNWGKWLLAGGADRDFVLDRVMVFAKGVQS